MTTTAKAAAFHVEAGFHERYARDLMLEGNWRGALRFLMTALTGMTLDIAVEIIQGKLSLKAAGEHGHVTTAQDVEDPHLKRYLSTYAWQHAGLWQVGNDFYQPYGIVTLFGQDDEAYAHEQMVRFEDSDFSTIEYRTMRAMFYAEHRESDLVHFSDKRGAALFKRVPGPAFWQKSYEDAESAVEAFLTLRNLSEKGPDEVRDARAADPSDWKFYVPAMRLCKLHVSAWAEPLLSNETREIVEGLVALSDAVQEALYRTQERRAGEASEGHDYSYATSVDGTEARFESAVARQEIREQAQRSGGFITLTIQDYDDTVSTVEVPATPLLLWASRHISEFRREDLPDWTPVHRSGEKMLGDDPIHTDWWVGAGFEPRDAYDHEHPLNRAAWNFAMRLSDTHGCDFVKLAGKGRAFGRVVLPKANEGVPPGSIAVVPFAGVDYEIAMLTACKDGRGAVIAATGGKLAHLATVAREVDARVVVVDDAMSAFKEGQLVSLDLDKLTLKRHTTIYRKEMPEDFD